MSFWGRSTKLHNYNLYVSLLVHYYTLFIWNDNISLIDTVILFVEREYIVTNIMVIVETWDEASTATAT